MEAKIKEEVEVPEGVELKLSGKMIEVSGPKGKLAHKFDVPMVGLKTEGQKILIETQFPRRKHRAAIGMIRSRLANMFKGVTTGFTYKLRVVYSHFPITIKVEGTRVLMPREVVGLSVIGPFPKGRQLTCFLIALDAMIAQTPRVGNIRRVRAGRSEET